MWLRSLSLILVLGTTIAPGADAAEPGLSGATHHGAAAVSVGSRRRMPASPTTMLYGLCTFPTAEGLERTCSTFEGCNDAAAGERWQAGCWFR
jgi:hypothetical protein